MDIAHTFMVLLLSVHIPNRSKSGPAGSPSSNRMLLGQKRSRSLCSSVTVRLRIANANTKTPTQPNRHHPHQIHCISTPNPNIRTDAATGRPIASIASMAAAASASSSCSSAGAFWRERRRDPEDPPAVDLPPSTAPGLAQRLAEALVTVVYKALDPGPEEDKAAAAVVVAPQLLKEGGGAQFGGRRPRLAER